MAAKPPLTINDAVLTRVKLRKTAKREDLDAADASVDAAAAAPAAASRAAAAANDNTVLIAADMQRRKKFFQEIEKLHDDIHKRADAWLERGLRDLMKKQDVMRFMDMEDEAAKRPDTAENEKQARRDRFRSMLNDAHTQLKQAEQDYAAAYHTWTDAKAAYETEDAKVNEVNANVESARQAVEDARSNIDSLSIQLEDTEKTRRILRERVAALRQNGRAGEAGESEALQALRSSTQKFKDRFRQLKLDEEAVNARVQAASAALFAVQRKRGRFMQNVVELQERLQQASSEANATYDALLLAQDKIKQLQNVLQPSMALLLDKAPPASAAAAAVAAVMGGARGAQAADTSQPSEAMLKMQAMQQRAAATAKATVASDRF